MRERFGAGVTVARSEEIAGDASTRRYARLWLEGPGAPRSAVAMILADRGAALSSEELGEVPPCEELPFVNVQRFLRSLGVPVPEIYVDATDEGLLLLEDVGDTSLRQRLGEVAPGERMRLFERAIEELVRIQVVGTARRDERCVAFHQTFHEGVYLWEFGHFLEYGIEKRLGPLPGETRTRLRGCFERIARKLAAEPLVLSHRDYHAWNLFLQGERLRILDFQDALLAAAPYDLATLLGDRDTFEFLSEEDERSLVRYYATRWEEAGGKPWNFDHLWDVYSGCALQKAFKIVGRFHYLAEVKGKRAYLGYLPSTLRRLEVLFGRVEEGREIRGLLEPWFSRLA